MSTARSERAEAYRHSRLAHAVRVQLAEQAAAEEENAEAGTNGSAETSHIALIVKADVQVWSCCQLFMLFFTPSLGCSYLNTHEILTNSTFYQLPSCLSWTWWLHHMRNHLSEYTCLTEKGKGN